MSLLPKCFYLNITKQRILSTTVKEIRISSKCNKRSYAKTQQLQIQQISQYNSDGYKMFKLPRLRPNRLENNQNSLKLPTPLGFLLKIFYCMGLSLFSNQKLNTRLQKVYHLKFSLFYIPFFFGLYVGILNYHFSKFYLDNFGKFNDLLKLTIVFAAHLTALIETTMTRESTDEFFRVYSKIHSKWSTSNRGFKQFKIYGQLFFYLGFCVFFILAVEVNYAIEVRNNPDWFNFFISYIPSVFVCRCRILQIIMFLELIRVELLQLNREIMHLAKATEKVQTEFIENVIYKDLTQCMKRYEDIFEMCEVFKKSTAVSLLVIFVKSCVKILSDCYWAYWVIYNDYDLHEIFECSLILPSVLNLFLLLIAAKHCMRAAKLIPQSLHGIRHRIENLRLSHKIQNFSLQISYQQIIIDAFGCFIIDCYMASGILGSITTYMLFYIQFMPKFKNL